MPFKGPEDEKDFWEGDNFDGEQLPTQPYIVPREHQQGLTVERRVVCAAAAAALPNAPASCFLQPLARH